MGNTSGQSYNQPSLSLNASWNSNAITFVSDTSVSREYTAIFVNKENTIYAADLTIGQILVWKNGSSIPMRNISHNLAYPWSLFVNINGDIYVNNGNPNHRVEKWMQNSTTAEQVISVEGSCTGLFIDINQNLYCSLVENHRVLRINLTNHNKSWTRMVGTGCPGPVSNTLNNPHGIFVDINFNLYVADTNNNRIQRFAFGESNGQTVAGFEASISFKLNRPTGIILDAEKYLFIVDSHNHRIIRSTNDGFRCIAGCSSIPGTTSRQLNYPHSIAFDRIGNIFVADQKNYRIQIFYLDASSNITTITTSTNSKTPSSIMTTFTTTRDPFSCANMTVLYGYDLYTLGDLDKKSFANYVDCCNWCISYPKCVAFTWGLPNAGGNANTCFLKNIIPNASWNPQLLSAHY